jgi:hypothetical protein
VKDTTVELSHFHYVKCRTKYFTSKWIYNTFSERKYLSSLKFKSLCWNISILKFYTSINAFNSSTFQRMRAYVNSSSKGQDVSRFCWFSGPNILMYTQGLKWGGSGLSPTSEMSPTTSDVSPIHLSRWPLTINHIPITPLGSSPCITTLIWTKATLGIVFVCLCLRCKCMHRSTGNTGKQTVSRPRSGSSESSFADIHQAGCCTSCRSNEMSARRCRLVH